MKEKIIFDATKHFFFRKISYFPLSGGFEGGLYWGVAFF
jgi:hypothetical protein